MEPHSLLPIENMKVKPNCDEDRNMDCEVVGSSVRIKQGDNYEAGRRLERNVPLTVGDVKQEPEDEAILGHSCTTGFISHVQKDDNMDRKIPRRERVEPGLCEEYEDAHSCTLSYHPFSRLKHLQLQKTSTFGNNHLELGNCDDVSELLPEEKNHLELGNCDDVSELLPEDNKNLVNKMVIMEDGTIVTEITRNDNTGPGMTENKTSMDGTDHQEMTADVCDTQNNYLVTVEHEDSSTESNTEFSTSDMDTHLCESDVSCRLRSNEEIPLKHKKMGIIGRPYKCDVCGVGFTRRSHLNNHKIIHTGEKPYKCSICGASFAHDNNLKSHNRIHTGEKPYKCDDCGVCFAQVTNLKRHKRLHTGEKPYTCDVCGTSFTHDYTLKTHKRTHTGEKPYRCDVCNASYADANNLKRHKRTHTGEKPYKCDVCAVGFSQGNDLNRHKIIHTGQKPYKCDVCGIGFTRNGDVNRHKRIHIGDMLYKCDVCGVPFAHQTTATAHKRVHAKEKPYKCDVSFDHNSALQTHKDTHTT